MYYHQNKKGALDNIHVYLPHNSVGSEGKQVIVAIVSRFGLNTECWHNNGVATLKVYTHVDGSLWSTITLCFLSSGGQ